MPHEGPLPHTSHFDAIIFSWRTSRTALSCSEWAEPSGDLMLAPLSYRPTRSGLHSDVVPTLERFSTTSLRELVVTFRDMVREHAGALNRLNVYPVPDGDTGTNMARTLDAVVAEMEAADADDLDATCDAISHGSLMGARGNSGVILSQIMRGFAAHGEVDPLPDQSRAALKFRRGAPGGVPPAPIDAVLKPDRGHHPHGLCA